MLLVVGDDMKNLDVIWLLNRMVDNLRTAEIESQLSYILHGLIIDKR